MVWFLYRYRYREGETRRATYTHGNVVLRLIWTIIPAIVFVGHLVCRQNDMGGHGGPEPLLLMSRSGSPQAVCLDFCLSRSRSPV